MDDGGSGGGLGQLAHLLCSALQRSWVLAPAPRLQALVAIVPSPLHSRGHCTVCTFRAVLGCFFQGGSDVGMIGLCQGSSMSIFMSLLSIFAILANSFHLVSFSLRTFSGGSPSAIFFALLMLALLSWSVQGFRAPRGCGWTTCVRCFRCGASCNAGHLVTSLSPVSVITFFPGLLSGFLA